MQPFSVMCAAADQVDLSFVIGWLVLSHPNVTFGLSGPLLSRLLWGAATGRTLVTATPWRQDYR